MHNKVYDSTSHYKCESVSICVCKINSYIFTTGVNVFVYVCMYVCMYAFMNVCISSPTGSDYTMGWPHFVRSGNVCSLFETSPLFGVYVCACVNSA